MNDQAKAMAEDLRDRHEALRQRMFRAKHGELYDTGDAAGREMIVAFLKRYEGNPIATSKAVAFLAGMLGSISLAVSEHMDHHTTN